jgi:hypothetical protein
MAIAPENDHFAVTKLGWTASVSWIARRNDVE